MTLAEKHCIPCNEGTEPITRPIAESYLSQVKGWELNSSATKLHRAFAFKNFQQALAFTNQVGELAEAEKHHPDLELGWGYVRITLQTHSICGLHENDFILAAKINRLG